MSRVRITLLFAAVLAGCGGEIVVPAPVPTETGTPAIAPTAEATASATAPRLASPSGTPLPSTAARSSTPTPTPTAALTETATPAPTLGSGANIGYLGVLRADNTRTDPVELDTVGRPVFERPVGNGFVIVVEAKPGTDGARVGTSSFAYDPLDPSVRPDLQVEVSRDLGNGSSAVCDNSSGDFGGVPGITPTRFDELQPISDALNDLGCRFVDGTGEPQGRIEAESCILFPDGEYHFVDPSDTVQFCATITRPMSFPEGDTVVTAQVRDTSGEVGPQRQLVIRVVGAPPVTPHATATATPTISATGANIGYLGILRGDNTVVEPTEYDDAGRPVFDRPVGSGFVIVVDAKPGASRVPVGPLTYDYVPSDLSVRPDLQIQVNRPLGNGSPVVCDNTSGNFGGVPGIDPNDFEITETVSDALNDLGCRFLDGFGDARGRTSDEACVLFPDGIFRFIDPSARVEFCGTITRPLIFPAGETTVTARVRDTSGATGPERQIIVRVGQ